MSGKESGELGLPSAICPLYAASSKTADGPAGVSAGRARVLRRSSSIRRHQYGLLAARWRVRAPHRPWPASARRRVHSNRGESARPGRDRRGDRRFDLCGSRSALYASRASWLACTTPPRTQPASNGHHAKLAENSAAIIHPRQLGQVSATAASAGGERNTGSTARKTAPETASGPNPPLSRHRGERRAASPRRLLSAPSRRLRHRDHRNPAVGMTTGAETALGCSRVQHRTKAAGYILAARTRPR